jgi:hypothetical protein
MTTPILAFGWMGCCVAATPGKAQPQLEAPNPKHPQSFVHHSAAKRTYDASARNEKGRRLRRIYFCGGASGNSGSWSFGSNHDALSDRHI